MTIVIKKQFTELNEALVALTNKKLTPKVLEELQGLMASKQASRSYITNEDGEVTAIRCYYYKEWIAVEHFAPKKTASGYNSMCRAGTNQWSKQQRVAKKAEAELLDKVIDGLIDSDDLMDMKAEIEADRQAIDYANMPPTI